MKLNTRTDRMVLNFKLPEKETGSLKIKNIVLTFFIFSFTNISAQDSIRTILIQGVEIFSKKEVAGADLEKNMGRILVDSSHKNYSLLTKFILPKRCKILSYNFYINSSEKYNSMPMKFVVYEDIEGSLKKIYVKDIVKYSKKTNKIEINDLKLNKGSYYFGLLWDIENIKNKDKYIYEYKYDLYDKEGNLKEKNKKEYKIGPALGFKIDKENDNYILSDDKDLEKKQGIILFQNIEYR